jgi:hypothetical protein
MNNYIKFINIYGDTVDKMDLSTKISHSTNLNESKNVDNILDEIKQEHQLIIGKAGIGKSTYIINNFSSKDYLMSAYTGIAANQINGHTISSIFKLGRFNENTIQTCLKNMKFFNKRVFEQLSLITGIVIDEFYTVPETIMEKVNIICQKIRKNDELFGGLKLILVGDDRQTECVDNAFVDTDLYKSLNCKKIILEEHDNMRLTKEYMKFCDMFRNPKLNRDKMLRLLNDKRFAKKEVPGYILYYTNDEINKRNKLEMNNFDGDVIYNHYKKGCPIYINSSRGELCNGMMGNLIDYIDNELHIEIDNKKFIVDPDQISFSDGFALSIHKSQAKTFPGVNIYIKKSDLLNGRAKYIRLLYVSMTRVRNFDKCYINIL